MAYDKKRKNKTSNYWACEDDIVPELEHKVETYYQDLEDQGHMYRMKKSYSRYYGCGFDSQSDRIVRSGSQGELSRVNVNHYRNLLKSVLTMVTANRPAFDVRPINTDYKSQAQALLGEQILDYYMRECKLETFLKDAVERSLVWSEGFIYMSWDSSRGEIYAVDPDDDETLMAGDVSYSLKNPLDIVRDIWKESEQDWVIVRSFANKYDVSAQFEEHQEEIESLSIDACTPKGSYFFLQNHTETDLIPIYEFYHRKSAALPEGRYVRYVGQLKLLDTPLPYEQIPIYRVVDGNLEGTCLGYTTGFDLLGLQDVSDELLSAVISNNIALANQILLVPKGANIDVHELGQGLSVIEYDTQMGEIKPVNLVNSSPETYKLIEQVQTLMQVLSSVNDVVRGDPKASLRSGNALALVAAQAIQFNSGLQHSYTRLIEDVGTATIKFLQQFANAPRYIAVVGKYNRSKIREFEADDISKISRVFVDVANPLSKTTAGRLELADNLLNAQLIKRPEQYLSVIETGNLHSLIESEQAELLLIKSENERLQEGQPAMAMATDDHRLHILEHKAVLADPDVREDPSVVEAVLAHMHQHIELWRSTDPILLGALQQQPIGPEQGAGGPPPAQGAADQTMTPEQPPEGDMPGMPSLPEGAPAESQEAYLQMQAGLEGGPF